MTELPLPRDKKNGTNLSTDAIWVNSGLGCYLD